MSSEKVISRNMSGCLVSFDQINNEIRLRGDPEVCKIVFDALSNELKKRKTFFKIRDLSR
ncbi:MAG: hypothetical protein ACE5KT_02620 [Methanosarcinales archaeon]|nr:hypothetical protein [Methanosarcinales archaeon]